MKLFRGKFIEYTLYLKGCRQASETAEVLSQLPQVRLPELSVQENRS